jgi:Beta-lactamase enzyme family
MRLNATDHFDSASVVKTIILAALLHRDKVQHRSLTAHEKSLAYSMITASNNNSATALWNDVGMTWLQRFLNLAQMNQTVLGQHGYWGLTRITASDETLLLWLLLNPNSVLTPADQQYELGLMAKVISSQRFGVPAGAPKGFTVHVKNGWAPLPAGTDPWYVNSTGCFTKGSVAYTIVVLTHQTKANPTFSYGVKTIENVAIKIHSDLNPGVGPAVPRSTPNATWGIPDEQPPGPGR